MSGRVALLVVVLVAVAGITVATSGVGPAQLDRGATIDVVDDSAAGIGYASDCSDGGFSVTVVNNFDGPLDDVTVAINGSTSTATPLPVAPGASRTVSFEAAGVSSGDAVVVTVSGEGFEATLDRSVPRSCAVDSDGS